MFKHDISNLKDKYRQKIKLLAMGEFDHTLIVSAVVCIYIITAVFIYIGVTR